MVERQHQEADPQARILDEHGELGGRFSDDIVFMIDRGEKYVFSFNGASTSGRSVSSAIASSPFGGPRMRLHHAEVGEEERD